MSTSVVLSVCHLVPRIDLATKIQEIQHPDTIIGLQPNFSILTYPNTKVEFFLKYLCIFKWLSARAPHELNYCIFHMEILQKKKNCGSLLNPQGTEKT